MATIKTTEGMIDEKELFKRIGTVEDKLESTSWVEYWTRNPNGTPAKLVHRSASVHLKVVEKINSQTGKAG